MHPKNKHSIMNEVGPHEGPEKGIVAKGYRVCDGIRAKLTELRVNQGDDLIKPFLFASVI